MANGAYHSKLRLDLPDSSWPLLLTSTPCDLIWNTKTLAIARTQSLFSLFVWQQMLCLQFFAFFLAKFYLFFNICSFVNFLLDAITDSLIRQVWSLLLCLHFIHSAITTCIILHYICLLTSVLRDWSPSKKIYYFFPNSLCSIRCLTYSKCFDKCFWITDQMDKLITLMTFILCFHSNFYF